MKRNISIVIGLVVILVIIVLLQGKSTTETATTNTNGQAQVQVVNNNSNTPTTNSTNTTKKPVVTYTTTPKNTSNTSYTNYVTNLSDATNKCNATAKAQYSSQYSALESASFLSYYNETTGGCYSKVIGKSRAAYATTTTSLMIFRDVNKNTNLAECIDTKGITFANDEWTCTDKTTGATINVPAFNGLIYKYTAK